MANSKISSTIAREEDGTVQITFTIPQSIIEKNEAQAVAELAKTAKVPGFRPGKAPLDKVKASASKDDLMQKTLTKILPQAFSDAIEQHKLKPATYPKFEIISQEANWQIRATTCEIADFDLGDYKNIAKQAVAPSIVTLDKKDEKKPTQEQQEQKVMMALLDSIKLTIPHILIEEEVNLKLSQLLERIEKLGLNLESYLSSVGKTPESIRKEYQLQTEQAISLELILNKIALTEKIEVPHEQIHDALKAMGADEDPHADASRHNAVESVLRRRAVLDSLLHQA